MTLAAYQLRLPHSSDIASIERDAQMAREREFDLQKRPAEVSLANAKNQLATDQVNDLAQYRMRALSDDPNAADSLKGQPEKFKELQDSFRGMTPDEYAESVRKAQAFGQAARRVAAFEKGSPQQQQVWDEELGKLFKGGLIDKQSHDHWVAQGPSPDIVAEAMEVDDFVKAYAAQVTKGTSALDEARLADIETDNERADALNKARIERYQDLTDYQQEKLEADIVDDEADNDRLERELEIKAKPKGGGSDGMSEAEQGRRLRDIEKRLDVMRENQASEAEIEAERKKLRTQYRIKPEGTAQDPHYPKTRSEAEALPSGAYFVSPDGKLIRKK